MKGITRIAAALMAVMFFMSACDVEKEPYIEGAENEKCILSFNVDSIVGLINEDDKTVTLTFDEGADLTHLTPTIQVSAYATIEPESGVAQDFTNPVYYTVTAMNGSTAVYMVSAANYDPENEKSILAFRFDDLACEGVVNESAKTVSVNVPSGTDVTHLVPTIVVSEGATVNPESGVEQDFTQPVEYTVTAQNGTTAVYTVTVYAQVEPTGKTVLIKDFTGARCVNCPAAAEYAHNLQHQLDENHIIIMSVHAGFLAQPVGQFPDFTTEEGTIWYGNNSSNPLFAVDHVALTEGNTLYVEQIDTPVTEALAEEQSFEIVVIPQYDEAARELTVNATATALKGLDGNFYVTACLVEDHVIGWQTTPGGIDQEYDFRNVFRGTLNGAEGSEFVQSHADADEVFYFNYSTTLNADYNADECYVLVYVYEKSTGKICQTAIKNIK